jgi:hypothetical protein
MRNVLILITAFTIGHSLTLLGAGLDIIRIPTDVVEFLIPVTILITALTNVLIPDHSGRDQKIKYGMALFFGLIHGMGFSNYFRSLLMKEDNIVSILLPFNLGVEAGQIVIVFCILLVSFLFLQVIGTKPQRWNTFVSGAAAGISTILLIEAWPW